MVVNRTSQGVPQDSSARHAIQQKQIKFSALLALTGAATALSQYTSWYYDKQCIHTSILTSQHWLDELIEGEHDNEIKIDRNSDPQDDQVTRYGFSGSLVEHFVFWHLLHELQWQCGLQDTRHVMAEEQLAIFLWIAWTEQGSLEMQEQFQLQVSILIPKFKLINASSLAEPFIKF